MVLLEKFRNRFFNQKINVVNIIVENMYVLKD